MSRDLPGFFGERLGLVVQDSFVIPKGELVEVLQETAEKLQGFLLYA